MAQPDARSDILAPAPWVEERGAKIRITAVSTFLTAPHGCPHLVVRVETNEPGLYGLGCASDPQRTLAVRSVLDDYLAPMLIGRDPDDIDDIHRLLLNSAYWRGGSVTGNALGGIDVALWDLKAKRLGAPLYSLFGGRVRTHADAYTHVSGADADEIADKVVAARERGYRHVRVQASVPGSDTYGTAATAATDAHALRTRSVPWDSAAYVRTVPRVLTAVRKRVGDEVELLHDAHERLDPRQARDFLRRVEDAGLYFVEDLLAPEDARHFAALRAASPYHWPWVNSSTTSASSCHSLRAPTSTSPGSGSRRWAVSPRPASSPPTASCAAYGSRRTVPPTSAPSRRPPRSP